MRRPKEPKEGKELWVEASKEKMGGSLAETRLVDFKAGRKAWNLNETMITQGVSLVGDLFTTCLLVSLCNADLKPIKYRNSKRSPRTNIKACSIPRIPHKGHLTVYQFRYQG